jgi:hypothetical protein
LTLTDDHPQARAFLDYAGKYPQKDMLSLFNAWAFSKDFSASEKQEIWLAVRRIRPPAPVAITENSDEFVRVDTVLKILFEADLRRLETLLEAREGQAQEV